MEKQIIKVDDLLVNSDKYKLIVYSCETMEQLIQCENIIANVYEITHNANLYEQMRNIYITKKLQLIKK
jgi:hypothetical protein